MITSVTHAQTAWIYEGVKYVLDATGSSDDSGNGPNFSADYNVYDLPQFLPFEESDSPTLPQTLSAIISQSPTKVERTSLSVADLITARKAEARANARFNLENSLFVYFGKKNRTELYKHTNTLNFPNDPIVRVLRTVLQMSDDTFEVKPNAAEDVRFISSYKSIDKGRRKSLRLPQYDGHLLDSITKILSAYFLILKQSL